MPSLGEVQEAFARALLGGDEGAAAGMVSGDGLSPATRVDIYRHHVFTTLTAALASTYPVVSRLVDERFFRYAADAYIRSNPPAGPCLHEYGGSFADFLGEFAPSRRLAYLPDVARLEWALDRAVHADAAAPVDPARLRAVGAADLPQLVLRLDPSLAILTSAWPADRIWLTNQPGEDAGDPVDLASGAVCLEVRRVGDSAVFRTLDAATAAFRGTLLEGRTLEDAAVAALAVDPAFDLARAIEALLCDGLVANFSLTPECPGPSPLWGEGRVRGAADKATTPPSPRPSPWEGEGAGRDSTRKAQRERD